MGIPFHLRFHIAEYEPASRALARVEGGMTGTFDWRVTPNGTGSELSLDIDYDMPGGAIGRAVNRIMLERMNDKNAERMLENIKMLSEAEPEPQPA
jgi:carbon monoxide dehydrogenase subunit G